MCTVATLPTKGSRMILMAEGTTLCIERHITVVEQFQKTTICKNIAYDVHMFYLAMKLK